MNAQQELNLNYNANNPNPYLDKYTGTWKWEENGKSFTIILKKQNIKIPPFNRNVTADIIYGFHQYIDNNNIVESSIEFSNTNFDAKKLTIYAGVGILCIDSILKGDLTHLSKNGILGSKKSLEFEIEYLDNNHIKLISLKNPQGTKVTITGQPSYDWSISLPQNIILTKQ